MPRILTTNMAINRGNPESRYHRFSEYCLETRPDIIAVQEVSADLGKKALQGLTKALGSGYEFHYAQIYPGQEQTQGAGVVTRLLPVKDHILFDPEPGRNRFQVLDLTAEDDQPLLLANVHAEAHPLMDPVRLRKLRVLMRHLNPNVPQVLAGDFNAVPRFGSIRHVKRTHASAHHHVHGREPSHTYPTDLGEHLLLNEGDATSRQLRLMRLGARLFQDPANRRSSGLPRMVADYIFVNHYVKVNYIGLTGHEEIELGHSDHRGLEADLTLLAA